MMNAGIQKEPTADIAETRPTSVRTCHPAITATATRVGKAKTAKQVRLDLHTYL